MSVAEDLTGIGLLDVAGRGTRWGDFLFLPAALWTPKDWGNRRSVEQLRDYTTAYLPFGVQPDGGNPLTWADALWVRARLPVALAFAPPTCRRAIRSQFLDAGMLAVAVEGNEPSVTAFICTDDSLEAELQFARDCPTDRRRAVAEAFWGLLASDPGALANYKDRCIVPVDCDFGPGTVGYWRGLFHLPY